MLPAWAIALIVIFPSVSIIVILSVYFAVVVPRMARRKAQLQGTGMPPGVSMSRRQLNSAPVPAAAASAAGGHGGMAASSRLLDIAENGVPGSNLSQEFRSAWAGVSRKKR
jgi:hypothetical protein